MGFILNLLCLVVNDFDLGDNGNVIYIIILSIGFFAIDVILGFLLVIEFLNYEY